MMMRKKVWISLAPSTCAASTRSAGTPLSAAEKSTMAKPVCIQTSTTIRNRLFQGWVVSPGLRLAAERRDDGVEQADLRLVRRGVGIDEAPDHARRRRRRSPWA